jgi:hypothetical protein
MVPSGPLVVRVVNTSSFFLRKGKPAMGNIPQQPQTLKALLWRRRARRISLPVDIELTFNNLITLAVIRDVSFSDDPDSSDIGVGFFHNEPLPLEEMLKCRTSSHTGVLPADSIVVLTWTRDFGSDGFLSGGRMQQCLSQAADDHKPSGNQHRSFEMTEQSVM